MKNYILILIASFALLACEETIQLDINQVESQIVIEGLVTNEMKNHYVRLSETNGFYEKGENTKITDATVTVSDNAGNIYTFSNDPESENEGLYLSDEEFEGQIGRTYNLRVEASGEVFTASEQLFPVTKIDTLEVILNENEFEDPSENGYFYEVLFSVTEPVETEDYYLFKFYRNDTLLQDSPTDVYFSDDKLLQENIDNIETSGFFKLGDKGTVEMYSITRTAFLYYNDLFNVLNNDGGFFSPPPVNPRTNLSNNAFGYFQVSSVARDSIIVEE